MTGALWWSGTVRIPGKATGVIGMLPTAAGSDSRRWIARSVEVLRSHGCTRILGPIERSCWGQFGEGIELTADSFPTLSQEPTIVADRLADWRASGFRTWRTWRTWQLPSDFPQDRRLDRVKRELGAREIEIRQWTAGDREELKPGILRLLHGWEGREPMMVHPPMGWARRWLGNRMADFEPMLCYGAWQHERLVGVIGAELLHTHERGAVIQGLILDANIPVPGLGSLLLSGVARQAQDLNLPTLYWRQVPDGTSLAATLQRLGTPIRRFSVMRWKETKP